MACFLVPVVEAVVVSVAARIAKSKEAEAARIGRDAGRGAPEAAAAVSFSRKLRWLSRMLWGGSALLAFEHVWHGEVTPWFPFLTAAGDPAEAAVMLGEMATVGVAMAALITAVWCGMLLVTTAMEKKALRAQPAAN